ncbi:HNH endonuclease [Rhizobium puerariae]|uniref:HNH endonuclease n=1 Tax=Rhizobium puerariae TaxID=1585791 RepID=A0ABV6ANH1_9HYPH
MARTEFTRKTKQEALKRAGYRCEASGTRYGFNEGQRCNCDLSLGVQFDHAVPDALGGDNSLENCMSVCVPCHGWKTRNDVKQIAKSKRQRDKHTGVIRPASKIKSAPFPKSPKAAKRQPKQALPPRPLYQEPNA